MHIDDIMMHIMDLGVWTPPGTWSRDPGSGVPGDQIWGPPPRAVFASMRLFGPSYLDPLFRGFMPFLALLANIPKSAIWGPRPLFLDTYRFWGLRALARKLTLMSKIGHPGVQNLSGS